MLGRNALVTGASSGIGREFAVQLARRGYAVTLVARREDRLQALVSELWGDGHDYLVADLSSEAGTTLVGERLQQGRYHLLINNAGYSTFTPFYESPLQEQQDILAVNCGAVQSLAHYFLNQAESGDALITVASIVGFLPTPAYPATS